MHEVLSKIPLLDPKVGLVRLEVGDFFQEVILLSSLSSSSTLLFFFLVFIKHQQFPHHKSSL